MASTLVHVSLFIFRRQQEPWHFFTTSLKALSGCLCMLSIVKRSMLSWFGHVRRHDMLSKVLRQRTVKAVVATEDRVNHGRLTPRNVQVRNCPCCWASQTTEIDWEPSQQRRLSKYTNDAPTSRELVSYAGRERERERELSHYDFHHNGN